MESNTVKYFKYAIGEIILVVLGILIALQINNWNESKKMRANERSSMIEVIENLRFDIIRCEKNYLTNTSIVQGLDSLRTSLGNTIDGNDQISDIYFYAIKYTSGYGQAVINRSAYDEMIASGTIKLIENKSLKFNLSDYYERITTVVRDFRPNTSAQNLKNNNKKFISLRKMEGYINASKSTNYINYDINYDYKSIQKMSGLKLLNTNSDDLNEYFNVISQYELDLNMYNFYLNWVKENAENLIQDIKKEYEIKQD
jgi:hypothetical protein